MRPFEPPSTDSLEDLPPRLSAKLQLNEKEKRLERRGVERSLSRFIREAWPILEPGAKLLWNWHLDVVCAYLEAFHRGRIKRLVLNVPPGTMKPVHVDELITTQRGRIRLEEVVVGDHVLTHTGSWEAVTAVHEQGVIPTLTLRLNSGRTLRLSLDHPVLTTRGWIEASKLHAGDVLAAVVEQEDGPDIGVSQELARFAGYLVGDGSCMYGQCTLTNANKDVIQDFKNICRTLGFEPRIKRVVNGTSHISVTCDRRRPSPIQCLLDELGLRGKSSYTKRIPDKILRGPKEVLAAFLGAYWSCDGLIERRELKTKTSYRASATTVSKDLAFDLQAGLLRLGIESRVRVHVGRIKTKRQGDFYTSYNVEVGSRHGTAKICQLPGLCESKRLNLTPQMFPRVLIEDELVGIDSSENGECRCLSVENDHSFVANGLAVHNSLAASVMYPAWAWTTRPTERFINLTNALQLATRDSRKMKLLVTSDWYQERWGHRVRLSEDQAEKANFANTSHGFREGLGLSANVTGRRGSRLIIDDPIDAADAFSDVEIASCNQNYDQAVSTRLSNPASDGILLIMQRLRTNDLAGHLLAKTRQKWVHVAIPMRYEGFPRYDPVKDLGVRYRHLRDPRRKQGELLWPDRFPEEIVQAMEEDLGDYGTAGQLQQRPSPLSGGILKKDWWRVWPKSRGLPHIEHVFASWDTAFTEDDLKTGAHSAMTLWGVFWNEHLKRPKYCALLLDRWNGKVEYPDLRDKAHEIEDERQPDRHLIEKKASGISLVQDMRRSGIQVYRYIPDRDKVARAYATQPLLKSGLLWVLEDRKWAQKVIDLVAEFPAGAPPSADYTDTVTQAALYLARGWWIEEDPEDADAKPAQTTDEDEDDDTEPYARRRRPAPAYG